MNSLRFHSWVYKFSSFFFSPFSFIIVYFFSYFIASRKLQSKNNPLLVFLFSG